MQIVPLAAVANQTFAVTLGGQKCRLNIYAKANIGVFIDVLVNDIAGSLGVICLDRVKIVREEYRGFAGDLAFMDTQGATDPVYTGFGTQYQLVYFEEGEI